MSTPNSTPIAGPSRTPSPLPATTYRIERYHSPPTSTDLMITSRAKRSTAGNRLKALLDQELEKDEIFAEVENDIDFEANENDDGVDIVDSDFDRDSDDDARGVEDESEGERELEEMERVEKQKKRAQARSVSVVKRPPPAPVVRTRTAAPTEQATGPKRRRISFAPDHQPSSSASPIDSSRRRSSARSATVQSKRQVESRLEEASQRRASQPVKQVVKKKASLTQDALIAEALEVEEENRESLRRFLEQEEERRAKQRQRMERITGPFVRWMSVGVRTRVVEEVKEGEKEKGSGMDKVASEGEKAVAPGEVNSQSGQRSEEVAQNSAKATDAADATDVGPISTAPPPSVQPPTPADSQSKEVTAEKGHNDDVTMTDATTTASKDEALVTEERNSAANTSSAAPPPQHRIEPTTSTTISAPVQAPALPTLASTSSLTLDPVIAARQQATLLRSSSSFTTAPTPSSTTTSSSYELQARTLLSVERIPPDWEWIDEFSALLGSHCSWDAFPYVPSRNRPLKPRQSICPITGLPALYKDPRTGIAYANAYAYGVIGKVVRGEFVWSGGHYERRLEGERGKKRGAGGGKVGTGAVPPEMGVWFDDERERGAGGVWELARSAAPVAKEATQSNTKQPKTQTSAQKQPSTPASTAPTRTASQPFTPATAAKTKQKPGFDVVLTNAIAPGDEKSVLAAALELPAGSTRSGRRVQRS